MKITLMKVKLNSVINDFEVSNVQICKEIFENINFDDLLMSKQ